MHGAAVTIHVFAYTFWSPVVNIQNMCFKNYKLLLFACAVYLSSNKNKGQVAGMNSTKANRELEVKLH